MAKAVGQAWTPEMVVQHLGEKEEDVTKRKKGAHGIPTQKLEEHIKLINFVSQGVCLKEDDKYLSKQVFMEVIRVFDGGKCEWAKTLAKAMNTSIAAIEDKGQTLYICASIWQELYN
ncbi:hypothetical protein GOP47_0000096 [Adiantum capillus-veneris]|uniref:Uncharacterized protein n=1 Tax=Adiantum capillus-veneris TaxID=13818 RepID=A0A9D4VCX7_ADICA|nr:hypothetical protein GOP47_0000096 [Adiantum capillus-veneris]